MSRISRFLMPTAAEQACMDVRHGQRIWRGDPVTPGTFECTLKIWRPKAEKPSAHFRFKNIFKREDYIRRWLENAAKESERKAEKQATQKKLDCRDHFNVGDLFYNSWGYDQTNIDYYQIIKVTRGTVKIQEIGCGHYENTSGMSGTCGPKKDSFRKNSKPMTKQPRMHNFRGQDEALISMRHGGSLSPCTEDSRHSWSSYA